MNLSTIHTLRVCHAPEDDGPIPVFFCAKYVVKHESESVKMADVEWAKVMVEGIVEELVVNGEVEWLLARFQVQGRLCCVSCALRSLCR